GRLGKRLTLRVDDLVHRSDELRPASPDTVFLDVVAAISSSGAGAVTVELDGVLVGIITDGDLRRAVQRTDPSRLAELRAAAVITGAPVTVRTGVLAYDALQLMEDRTSQIGVLPGVDASDHCVGIVRLHHLLPTGIRA